MDLVQLFHFKNGKNSGSEGKKKVLCAKLPNEVVTEAGLEIGSSPEPCRDDRALLRSCIIDLRGWLLEPALWWLLI